VRAWFCAEACRFFAVAVQVLVVLCIANFILGTVRDGSPVFSVDETKLGRSLFDPQTMWLVARLSAIGVTIRKALNCFTSTKNVATIADLPAHARPEVLRDILNVPAIDGSKFGAVAKLIWLVMNRAFTSSPTPLTPVQTVKKVMNYLDKHKKDFEVKSWASPVSCVCVPRRLRFCRWPWRHSKLPTRSWCGLRTPRTPSWPPSQLLLSIVVRSAKTSLHLDPGRYVAPLSPRRCLGGRAAAWVAGVFRGRVGGDACFEGSGVWGLRV
jgi:hypothetical protein